MDREETSSNPVRKNSKDRSILSSDHVLGLDLFSTLSILLTDVHNTIIKEVLLPWQGYFPYAF